MQHIERFDAREMRIYHDYLQSDHDYTVWADVLTLEEKAVGSAEILDGQVNFARSSDGPNRTASVMLSDPEGALSFGTSYARDDSDILWVNRLLRLNHRVVVPTLGEVVSTAMIGVPTSVSRNGGEISMELGDKSLLANHGVRAVTYKKGMRVDRALRKIMRDLTGEHHLRIPTTKKTLSKSYSAGMGEDSLTPWQLFKRIAGQEMGWRSFYSSDGFATCEPTSTHRSAVKVHYLLSVPRSSTPFTDFSNYVKVTSNRKITIKNGPGKKDDKAAQLIRQGVAVLPQNHDLSEQSLARHGVPRTLPLVINDDDLKSKKQVNNRAKSEMKTASDLRSEQAYEIMPFFHLDFGDKFDLPEGVGEVTFDEVSIPLGTGGNMSLGDVKWVSRPVKVKRVRSKSTVRRNKKKGGKKNG